MSYSETIHELFCICNGRKALNTHDGLKNIRSQTHSGSDFKKAVLLIDMFTWLPLCAGALQS